ncbi:hypothetical protein Thal_0037 [Thermocrinis albus DSM 14484]|uniref:Uncharacterized protein n=1 Tax=Thermocrinis albus (strain DSM 14484 / JCM 11386 / HI 11/12) TaxID=638303 RepID=D3SND8_THEAH|nr:prepilin-type N-terminal cleavage/methylation domain-containing protein [Thermocrinis albus]ADC88675.1 hypothetical protein Thal_0037 [Thermocrinis albus DSM 14484]
MDKQMKKGMTIVELVIVIAIISILMSFAYSWIRSFILRERLREAAYDIKSQLDDLRMRSYTGNVSWCVRINNNANSYEIRNRDFTDCGSQGNLVNTINLPPGVRFGRDVFLCFSRMGYPVNNVCGFGADRIVLTDDLNRNSVICINRYGRITVLHDTDQCPGG